MNMMETCETSITDLSDADDQKCYMDVSFMKEYSLKVACYVCLSFQNRQFICQVWPHRRLSANTIEYSANVHRQIHAETETEKICHIEVVKPKIAENVTITLIISSFEELSTFRMELNTNPTRLEGICRQLLYKVCIAENYEVNLEKCDLAKMYGVSFILVNAYNCPGNYKDAFIMIHNTTKVIIDKIQCKEHYIQISNSKKMEMIGGLESVLEDLQDLIMFPYKMHDIDARFSIPRGILLRGPPGTGKTSLVKEVTQRCKAYLITINGPEVTGARSGETEENMNKIFTKALAMGEEGPCVLFIDEIESLCPKRWKSGDMQESRATGIMLSFFDKIHVSRGLVIIGATNRPSELDPALRRPGRFDKEVDILPILGMWGNLDLLNNLLLDKFYNNYDEQRDA